MGQIDYNSIGKFNQGLVKSLKDGAATIDAMTKYANVSDWVHAQAYNYDLSYGVMACGNNAKTLPGKFVGIKYYCIDKSMDYDMKKRIVHIFDRDNKTKTQKFYRLTHTPGKEGARDNSYCNCEEIINIP